MAKKAAKSVTVSGTPPLDTEWADEIPEALQAEVKAWRKAERDKAKHVERAKEARARCIVLMQEHGIQRISLKDEGKAVVLENVPQLKTEREDNEDAA